MNPHWNDFFTGLLFLTDSSGWPLQVVMRSFIIEQSMLGMSGMNSPTQDLPRYFVKGIILGAVKG